ncbi:hypothetical protein [Pontivivens ytuae]|uniref:Uncharacterized protein n=1 Tax=Pontivivens ytuae TaxID=2789856 RepID=A0A7S9LSJ7_9RHOB|nr:hypothetical protein [Pontivivens ytuae]QPH54519.1 hypothetical protein I0K15_01690 [Pontivivens ytuae]
MAVMLQRPIGVREGYGVPALTDQDKANILGLNAARLHGIDVEAKKKASAADPFGRGPDKSYAEPNSGGDEAAMCDFEMDRKYV